MSDLTLSALTVVGAGPAGIMAAYTAAEAGVDVTIIDDNPLPGGQYYRQSPAEFMVSDPVAAHSGRPEAVDLYRKLEHPKIKTLYNMGVWGVFDQRKLALADGDQSYLLQADRIVLATGAYDRPLAFPGWTLPGVFGAGATLRMVKTQWLLPGKRILLAGLGPLQLALADTLLKLGAQVVCVADAADPMKGWRHLPKFWRHWDRLGEAYTYLNTLRKHKVPLLSNHAIVEATGKDHVESATIASLDGQGAPMRGTERRFEVDTICLGYGLLPSLQLASALDCELRYDANLGWYVPVHNEKMETTQPGVFVAGDVTDSGGAKVAIAEGRVAGLTAAFRLGYLNENKLNERLQPAMAELAHYNRLAEALQAIYAYRPGLTRLAQDDTLLCRCEEVTYGEVRQALDNGADDLHQVKLYTRAGMGYCQGRFCSVLIAPLIAQATGRTLAEVRPFTVRPPIQPIPINVLAAGPQSIRKD
jgi:NADPH-dependent 2,4-dienoyl-CoA reductase/sulfur reductase-like enzyme